MDTVQCGSKFPVYIAFVSYFSLFYFTVRDTSLKIRQVLRKQLLSTSKRGFGKELIPWTNASPKQRRTSELLISGLKSDTHRAGPYVGALKPILHPEWLENFEGFHKAFCPMKVLNVGDFFFFLLIFLFLYCCDHSRGAGHMFCSHLCHVIIVAYLWSLFCELKDWQFLLHFFFFLHLFMLFSILFPKGG